MKSYPLRLPEELRSKAWDKAGTRYLNKIVSILIEIWLSGRLDEEVDEKYEEKIKDLRFRQATGYKRKNKVS